MNIPSVFWLVPIASIVALGMAFFFFRQMMAEDEGTPRMKEIALYVRKGAMAYLWQQYKVVGIVFVVLCALFAFMAYGLNVQNPWVPFAFLTGGFFSGLAGFFGMKTATYASARTANAARQSLNSGLKVAFRSGAVMGLTVVGLGLLDIAIWFIALNGSWVRSRPTFLRTTRATPQLLPITLVIMLATWQVWELTSTSHIAVRCCQLPPSVLLPSPLQALRYNCAPSLLRC